MVDNIIQFLYFFYVGLMYFDYLKAIRNEDN